MPREKEQRLIRRVLTKRDEMDLVVATRGRAIGVDELRRVIKMPRAICITWSRRSFIRDDWRMLLLCKG